MIWMNIELMEKIAKRKTRIMNDKLLNEMGFDIAPLDEIEFDTAPLDEIEFGTTPKSTTRYNFNKSVVDFAKKHPIGTGIAATSAVALPVASVAVAKAWKKRKENSRAKTASFNYDEMVKFAYEDILGGFEKSAEENEDEEAKRQEHKKKVMKRLAAAGALAAAVPAVSIAAYKYDHRPGKYHPKTVKYRKDAAKAMKGKPVTRLRDDEWEIVTPDKKSPVVLAPLLSASNPHLLPAAH